MSPLEQTPPPPVRVAMNSIRSFEQSLDPVNQGILERIAYNVIPPKATGVT